MSRLRFLTRRLACRRCLCIDSDEPSKEAFLERYAGRDKGIVGLILDNPDTMNAICVLSAVRMLKQMGEALDEVRFDKTVRALILRPTSGAFCAGADLRERRYMTAQEVARFLHDLRRTFSSLENLPVPTIAAIDGPALGGGLELALCCDLRVAGILADKIGLTETSLAVIPGAGGTQRLARLIGPARAKELIFTARVLDSRAAHQAGIIEHLAEGWSLAADRAMQLAREILPNGPLAIRAAKLAVDTGSQLDLESGLDFERAMYATILPTKDRLEGLASFAEKREPEYKGE